MFFNTFLFFIVQLYIDGEAIEDFEPEFDDLLVLDDDGHNRLKTSTTEIKNTLSTDLNDRKNEMYDYVVAFISKKYHYHKKIQLF